MTNGEFQERVRACRRKLYGVAYIYAGSQGDFEDALQEALLKAWKKLGSLRDERYFETWLMRIVINECRAQHRQRRRRGEVALTPDIPLPESQDTGLHEALKALPEKYSVLLTLMYLDGYSVDELARILKLPRGTVATRLKRARELLRAELGEEGAI